MIAGALAQASDILLLDEPTTSLDLGFQFEIAALLAPAEPRSRHDDGGVDARFESGGDALHGARAAEGGPRAGARARPIDVLTAENIRALYGVDADVTFHPRAGHLTVVPLARADVTSAGACRSRSPAFGALTAARLPAGAARRQHADHLSRVFDRSIPFADNVDAQVFFVARLPRVLAAALVGSGLALSGVVFQALLRNPLASPDTLGVSAGATLGAMLVLTMHVDFTLLRRLGVPLASFAGALGALAIVFALSLATAPRDVEHGAAAGRRRDLGAPRAVGRFFQYIADFTDTFRTVQWLMGSLDVGSYAPIVAALVPMASRASGSPRCRACSI